LFYDYVLTDFFCCAEEVFLIPWGIIPTLKGLRIERAHVEGNTIFIDNRKLQINLMVKNSTYNYLAISSHQNLGLRKEVLNINVFEFIALNLERK
jgi:hypothetical protein